jgi:hypothetical protein
MKTVTADDYKRVRIPDAEPGQVFAYEAEGKIIKLTPVKADENVPVVRAVKGPNGLYRFPANAKPSREEIIRYIRAERDAQ